MFFLISGIVLAVALAAFLFLLHWYGVYVCFKKKWYMGLAAVVVPMFALFVGAAKFIFKSDLLK
jgi:hypothetical protein